MLKQFSAQILGNSELISMILVSALILLIASFIYKILPDRKIKQKKLFRKVDVHDVFWIVLLSGLYAVVSLWNLGSMETIGSFWQPVTDHEEIILELAEYDFDEILWVSGEGNNTNSSGYQNQVDFLIQGSNDLNVWDDLCELTNEDYLKIQHQSGVWSYRYIKIISRNSYNVLNEIGFKKLNQNELIHAELVSFSNDDSIYSPEAILDEQEFLILDESYMNETYFDEIYHTRNAQEIANHQRLYAYVHPLFGTQIISLGISIFGLSPFGWRIMGALFGILMMPLMYLCGLHIFHKRRSAVFACFLLGIECMHYTTSRIGTLEPFSVFFILLMTYFMFKYIQTDLVETTLSTQFKYLALSGIFMGCACATKFTGVYGGIGLAVLFFMHLSEQIHKAFHNEHKKQLLSLLIKTGLWCVLFFVIVPACIYVFSYAFIKMENGFSLQAVIDQTMGMYDYHKNLNATHSFQSVWWQWILDIRPIWYYVKRSETTMQTISAMGNPIVFWCGAVSMLWCFKDAIKHKSKRAAMISIAYLAQLIPWLMVDRCIFIYHYYPSVPFMILGIVHACESLLNKDKNYIRPIGILTIAAAIVFFLFLPVIGGFETTSWYIQHITRWMNSWYFG